MSDSRSDLRSYYEEEARLRLRKPQQGQRVEFRSQFITLLLQENRRSVVDFGAGPGIDGSAFVEAGLRYVGLDLAHGNGVLAAENGLTVIQGSITDPPFRSGAFDAGWSMSTLMHLPEGDMRRAMAGMTDALRSGAPLFIGLWGGASVDLIDEDLEGQRRLYSLRTVERNQQLLRPYAKIERSSTWDLGPKGWHYQAFELRVEHRSTTRAAAQH